MDIESIKECIDDISESTVYDDTFSHRGRVHDWRNHVPEVIECNWSGLSIRERKLVAITAQHVANKEVWE